MGLPLGLKLLSRRVAAANVFDWNNQLIL